jgi:hypothetical protein
MLCCRECVLDLGIEREFLGHLGLVHCCIADVSPASQQFSRH